LHLGVYLVSHPVPPPLARELAAVLACAPGSLMSHRSAAQLWAMVPIVSGPVDVTVVGREPNRPPGLRVHGARDLSAADVRTHHGIALTAPARTLLDLAAVASPRDLERALAEAQVRHLVDREELLALLRRAPRRRGSVALRALLDREAEPALTRSEAEERVLALVRAADLPPPEVNARVGRHEVDLLWRAQRLVVEVDGYAFHAGRAAFERDRLRDAELQAAGLRVMRLTWRQLVHGPEALLVRLTRALDAGPVDTTTRRMD
jgi:very-short-patch-repair endonuclease